MTLVMPKRKKDAEHYVNNKEFLYAIVEYKRLVSLSESDNVQKPRIPHYIGECFLKIATHLSYKPNFVNYMFREDMVSDGIENCVQYINNLVAIEVESTESKFIDTQFVLCGDKEICPNYFNGEILSHDGSHLTPFGASFMGDKLKNNLKILDVSN